MNRLLRISLDILVTSIVPIVQCFLIGIILDANLINVFSLTYPLQFVVNLLKSIFATGANILACQEKDKNAVDYGIFLGVLVGAVLFGLVAYHIESYIQFMNMDVEIYRVFGIYSVFQIYLQLVLQLILTKLYYQEENKKANHMAICFNVVNFVCIIGFAALTKNQVITVSISLLILFIYTTWILITNIDKFEFQFSLLKCIKYDSVEFFNAITFLLIYLFGFKNAFSFGENYVLAITFATLVTDMQWDIGGAIKTVAKVDISKKQFIYQQHVKNAYRLIGILVVSIIFMALALKDNYQLDWTVSIRFIGFEIISLMLYPLYIIKTCYLQLEYSAPKATLHKEIANVIRMVISAILATPYCTIIGQMISVIYQLISTKLMWMEKENKLEKVKQFSKKIECH